MNHHPDNQQSRLFWRSGRGRFFLSLFVTGGLSVFCTVMVPAFADRATVYTVEKVAVDVTAGDAAKARELALIRGQREAYDRLLSRLTLASDRHKPPSLRDSEIAELVLGIEIDNEKTSSVRYIADLTVSFKPDAVQTLLGGHDVAFSEVMSRPVLVIPVYEEAGKFLLWEDHSPWLAAWRDHPLDSGVVPMILPLADLGDFAAITPGAALEGNPGSLRQITRRYEVNDALVVFVRFHRGGFSSPHALEIILNRYGQGNIQPPRRLSLEAKPGESRSEFLKRAVSRIVEDIEASWKLGGLRWADDRPDFMIVEVPLQTLQDWVMIETKIAAAPLIADMDILAFSRRQALIELYFFGTIETLKLALAQDDLVLKAGLSKQGNPVWILANQDRS